MQDASVQVPGGFVPAYAVAFGAGDAGAVVADRRNPLPVAATVVAAAAAPLAGATSVSGAVGPFAPDLGRAIWLTLWGSWTGTVRLLRSVDGGATRLPLTYGDGSPRPSWSGACQAAVAEESVAAATYWLDVALTSGTLNYRLEQ